MTWESCSENLNAQRSAWRRTRPTRCLPQHERVRLFLEGGDEPAGHNAAWHKTIADNISTGKTMQRLKIVRRPFTDYTRFLFAWGIPGNVKVGEDYRILDATERSLDIPEQDFWLFDDTAVALLNFNDDGTLRNLELAEPAELGQFLKLRELALSEAVPFSEYRT